MYVWIVRNSFCIHGIYYNEKQAEEKKKNVQFNLDCSGSRELVSVEKHIVQ